MKKQYIVLTVFAALLLLSFENGINSNGAPIASTGAPAEQTCAKSTCHGDYAINSGPGLLNLDFNNGSNTYQPGQTYNITVSLNQQGINRFGFQLAALNTNDTEAGTLQITDSARTQILAGLNEYTGRKYATYRYPGTEPFAEYLGQWTFQWTAPQTDEGDITFYYAGVSANNDGTDFGDQVYTNQLVLHSTATAIQPNEKPTTELHVFPNPAVDILSVNYNVAQSGNTTIELYNLLSQNTVRLLQRFDATGIQTASVQRPYNVTSGVYLLTIHNGSSVQSKKIILQ